MKKLLSLTLLFVIFFSAVISVYANGDAYELKEKNVNPVSK